ncbi:MAG: radical SAM family heme chaperone HemW [Geobacter sp.]|nr:radical SAM family heme chaperone HemW [Geobacter sp.]
MQLALYIHVPFCTRKCRYCDFASQAGSSIPPEEYVAAMLREMALRRQSFPRQPEAVTLYIGGGTPSLLAPRLIGSLIDATAEHFALSATAEITLEANPGTVTLESLAGYRTAGVNRLSLGVQSLNDGLLEMLGRIHTADEARQAVVMARAAGFDNLGIDLIHSLPGQSLTAWEQTLAEAVALGPEHISAYGLSIEEGTPFHAMMEQGELELPPEETAARMLETTMELLPAAGYAQYEIANFSRPGRRSRHNQVYWQRGNYLGFGAAAHSFLREPLFGRRWNNPTAPLDYLHVLATGILPDEQTMRLSRRDAMGEAVFLGLRLLEGIDPAAFAAEFGESLETAYPGALKRHFTDGLLQEKGGRINLTKRGLLLANRVFASFV